MLPVGAQGPERKSQRPYAAEIIARGQAAAAELNSVAVLAAADAVALKTEVADAQKRRLAEAAAAATKKSSAKPKPSSAAEMTSITMRLDSLLDELEPKIKDLVKPRGRPPTPKFGAAQAVASNKTQSRPPSPPAKLYNVHAPSTRRLAAMHSLSFNSLPAAARSGGTAGMRGTSAGAGIRAGAIRPSNGTLQKVSSSPTLRLPAGLLLRDGLTPGQRALGATGKDLHSGCRALVASYGRPVMLPTRSPPKPAARAASESELAVTTRDAETRRRKLFASPAWIEADEAEEEEYAAMVAELEARAAAMRDAQQYFNEASQQSPQEGGGEDFKAAKGPAPSSHAPSHAPAAEAHQANEGSSMLQASMATSSLTTASMQATPNNTPSPLRASLSASDEGGLRRATSAKRRGGVSCSNEARRGAVDAASAPDGSANAALAPQSASQIDQAQARYGFFPSAGYTPGGAPLPVRTPKKKKAPQPAVAYSPYASPP